MTLTTFGSSPEAAGSIQPLPAPAPTPPTASAAPTARRILVIAHRGGETATPESTLAAFGNAIAAGADGIVFDVRLTRDGIPVVLHDETLNRTTDCSGRVDRLPARELRRCNAAHNFPEFGFQHVPTLDEALRFITARSHTITLYLHAKKVRDNSDAEAIVAVMRRWRLADTARATLLADNPKFLDHLHDVGAHRLGLVFHDFDSGYALHSDWPVLFAWDARLTESDVAAAARRGQLLLASQDHPQSLDELVRIGVPAVSADDVDRTLQRLRRAPAKAV
jgi:glycerophosphoryl diester phosphodiesterase